jgi:hypothetical protein
LHKPTFPKDRACNYFNLGDRAVVHVNQMGDKFLQAGFFYGFVIGGWRHHDGAVHVVTDEKISNNKFYDGHNVSGYYGSPLFMLKNDFQYLLRHPKFVKTYLEKTEPLTAINTDFDFEEDLLKFIQKNKDGSKK